ncbi:MAG TPA: ABC transporter permease [Mycobacteriales bacterium]|nr:ABC transporter permease [Mycobacteriales bacterium]
MTTFVALTLAGLVTGCVYALTAAGLVVTYTTAGVFNFAQGAMGMMGAFSFWQLYQGWHVPLGFSLLIVLGGFAPLFGAVVARVLLGGRAAGDQSLAMTLALLLVLIGAANAIWKPTTARTVPLWAGHGSITIGIFTINAMQLLVIATAIAIAIGLRLMFTHTRLGMAMRAAVDNPDLLGLYGEEPAKVQQFAWALSSVLAALAGVLLVPLIQMNILNMTLLVVNGYAAAMVGRLRSLPRTTIGALALGLGMSYAVGYSTQLGLDNHQSIEITLQQGMPMLLLFAVLVFLRPDPLRTSAALTRRLPAIPSLRQSGAVAAGGLVLAVVLSRTLSDTNLETASLAVVMALIAASLVLLSGYGGQTSLCALTFAGVGAYVMAKSGSHTVLGLLLAVVISAAVGALVALPTLRLRGLYLALATFAFGGIMDVAFFGQRFGSSGSISVHRLSIPGLGLASDRGYFVFCSAVFLAVAVGLLAVRRGRYGRQLTALGDSPAACATIGLSIPRLKLVVFAASSGLAGLAGALFGGLGAQYVSTTDFAALQSAVLYLLLRVGGVKSVAGALIAGTVTAVLPVLQQHIPSLGGLAFLVTGVAALFIGRFPDGIAGEVGRAFSRPRPRIELATLVAERKDLAGASR